MVVLLLACKTKSGIVNDKVRVDKDISAENLKKLIKERESKYEYFTCRFNAKISLDKSTNNINGKIRAKNGEVIWLSVFMTQVLELARLKADADTVIMVNYIEKNFFKGGYQYLSGLFKIPFNFELLESLLIGKINLTFSNETIYTQWDNGKHYLGNAEMKALEKSVSRSEQGKMILQGYWIDPQILRPLKMLIYDPFEMRSMSVEYKKYVEQNGDFVPSRIELNLQSKESQIKAIIDYSKIDLKTEVGFPINIPQKYAEIK